MATLLLVHAHPDDEAIGTGGVMARAHRAGHRVVLVTGTRGELGEIHNLDEESTRPRLGEVRTQELEAAARLLGVDRQVWLGFRDSGMAGEPSNDDRRSFHSAPLPVAAERLAVVLRQERPDVVVTYTKEGTYGHPDHIKAYQTTVAALDLLRDEGWEPERAYEVALPQSVVDDIRARMVAEGVDEADAPGADLAGTPDALITVKVDVRDLAMLKRDALAVHVSQIDPRGPWSTMQQQVLEAALGWEYYVRSRGVGGPEGTATSLLP
jgi:LmbE family N-acetylglucosaminyl deacetylase